MHKQKCVGLGGEGTDLFQSLAPSPGGACTSCDSKKPSYWPGLSPRAAVCKVLICPPEWAPQCPTAGAGLGVCCQSALTSNHKPMVSWKEIWALEAKEPRAGFSSDTDMGSSPHLSGQWGASSYS